MTNFHGFVYGASRVGKTTFGARLAGKDGKLLVVTREPGPAQVALDAEGIEAKIYVPKTPEEFFVFLDYPALFAQKNLGGFAPTFALFDNLQGLQQLVIGEPATKEEIVAGITIPAKPATGTMRLPVRRTEAGTGMAQLDYGTVARYTRRALNGIDSLPYSTLITSTETLGFDEKFYKAKEGLSPEQAAGKPRKIKGWPATEGTITKQMLPALVSGFFLHLTCIAVNGVERHLLFAHRHEDDEDIDWFANPRSLKAGLKSPIDWTGKNPREILW